MFVALRAAELLGVPKLQLKYAPNAVFARSPSRNMACDRHSLHGNVGGSPEVNHRE